MNSPPPVLELVDRFQVPWVAGLCGGCASWFEKPGLLGRHYQLVHPGRVLKFFCSLCDRDFAGCHAARCHFTVCRGRVDRPVGEFVCEVCSADFRSRTGLSMHERHVHPALRNMKRVRGDVGLPRPRPGGGVPGLGAWSVEEVDVLVAGLRGRVPVGRYTHLFARSLPGRTPKQIRDKVVSLVTSGVLAPARAVGVDLGEAAESSGDSGGEDDVVPVLDFHDDDLRGDELVEDFRTFWLGTEMVHPLSVVLRDKWVVDPVPSGEWIDSFVSDLTAVLLGEPVRAPGCRGRGPGGRAGRKRRRFAVTQEMYKKCPSRLAECLRLGLPLVDDAVPVPPVADVRRVYSELWETPGVCGITPVPVPPVVPVTAVTHAEVLRRIKALRPGSAPGPDGLRKSHLVGVPGVQGLLSGLSNLLLFTGHYPACWRVNSTSMIPKDGKDLGDAGGWRPITVGPLLARLHSSLVEVRVRRSVALSPRQRGFVEGNGCFLNCYLLHECLRRGKQSALVGASIDLAKAFDSVPHQAIGVSLRAKGVPAVLVRSVEVMYEGISTCFKNCGMFQVAIRRGVKQGDPLSPLLFNVILDFLLEELHATRRGFSVGAQRIPVLAFADDLILLADSELDLQVLLDVLSSFLFKLGMSVNVGKCGAFSVFCRARTWVSLPVGVSVRGVPLRSFAVDEPFRYLGATFTVHKGLGNDLHYSQVEVVSAKVMGLALKPMQKLDLLYTYVLPAFYHLFIADPPGVHRLRLLDSALRRIVRSFFHLPLCVTDEFFHSMRRDGGLGLPKLEVLVRAANVKAVASLLRLGDPVVDAVFDPVFREKIRVSCLGLGLPWPPSDRDVQKLKFDTKKECFARWAQLPSQGRGVRSFKGNKVGNSWLFASELFPGEEIDLMRLRTNTFPTLEFLARQAPRDSISCRRCGLRNETLGHVLGECPAGRPVRLVRHDRVVDLIGDTALGNGLTVAKEQLFTPDAVDGVLQEPLRPDLVVVSPDSALIVDVTVRFEQENSLAEAFHEKTRKYSPLFGVVGRTFGVPTVRVVPIVLGARGGFPVDAVRGLVELGVEDVRVHKSLVMDVLRSSVAIARGHVDLG